MYKVLIVEDDKISGELLKQYCFKTGFLEVVTVIEDGMEAVQFLSENSIDILFLDVNLPNLSGLEIMKSLNTLPQIILCTSDINYGPQAFEYNAVDYIVKPTEYPRFLKAVNKAVENLNEKSTITIEHGNLFIKSNGRLVNLNFDDILYIEALSDYVTFCTKEKKYIVHSTMKDLETKLPSAKFIRVHRSFIVNIDKIELIEDSCIIINKTTITIGLTYKDILIQRLNVL
ncbi:MAG: DNA-binding response regulator [Bacteroidetes bacterium]|nr:MAG: DNA-binding response regulator [Bacteroidota bacterium]